MSSYNYDYFLLSNGQKWHVRYTSRLWKAGLTVLFLVGVAAVGGYVIFRRRPPPSPLDNYQQLNTISAVASTALPPATFDPSTNREDHAVVSSLYSDIYATAITTLGYSLKTVNVSARMILMYLPDRVSTHTLCIASAAGWTLHPVPFIPPPHGGEGIHLHFKDQYTKLNLWKLDSIGIKSAIYLDADTLVHKNFDELFTLPFNFTAVPDVFSTWRGFRVEFNAGIMFLRPNSAVFEDMISQLETADYPLTFAEQAFLNLYFGAQAARLPYAYNSNLAIKQRSPKLWEALVDDMRIVHYTIEKPFPKEWLELPEWEGFFDERRSKDDGFWDEEMSWWQASWRGMIREMQPHSHSAHDLPFICYAPVF